MAAEGWRRCTLVTLLTVLLGPAVRAETPPAADTRRPVDVKLLEFLGSVDPTPQQRQSDGGSWMVYLSRLRLPKPTKSTPGAAAAPAKAAPASNGSKVHS